MAEIILGLSISGEGTLDEDLNAFKKELGETVKKAMDSVGADMIDALKRHIQTDVYNQYSPQKYKRRSKNPELGTPLNDMSANATVYNKGAAVTLDYSPTGAHTNENWHTADADDLIKRIEKKNPPYFPKAQSKVPPRPFWENFVNEMVDDEELERYFVSSMQMLGKEVSPDGALEREASDGDY